MTPRTILAGGIATPDNVLGRATVRLDAGRIAVVEPGWADPRGDGVVDARDLVVSAGLIDIHTHGASGAQAVDGTAEAATELSRFYATHGVTGFLASIGGSHERIETGLSGWARAIDASAPRVGARCLGLHLEGPFINPAQPGAFIPATIVAPDPGLLQHYLDLAAGNLRIMTMAPELDGAPALMRLLAAAGTRCAIGHSAASAEEVELAVERGASLVTHLFNAMPGLHHRRPGIPGAALTDQRLTVELIADGFHLDPRTVAMVVRAKPWQEIALVTDSMGAAGLPDGAYRFEDQDITVCDGAARLADGTLASSTLTLDAAVRNVAAFAGVPWTQALASATVVPARILGLGDRKGAVRTGFDADLAAFDAQHQVAWTMVAGEVVYQR